MNERLKEKNKKNSILLLQFTAYAFFCKFFHAKFKPGKFSTRDLSSGIRFSVKTKKLKNQFKNKANKILCSKM